MIYSNKKYNEFKRYLGNNIRIHREDNGISQEDLAKAILLETADIINLEEGKENPTAKTILKVSCGLEIDPCTLLDTIYEEDESGKRVCISSFNICDKQLTKEEKKKLYDEMVASGKHTPPDQR